VEDVVNSWVRFKHEIVPFDKYKENVGLLQDGWIMSNGDFITVPYIMHEQSIEEVVIQYYFEPDRIDILNKAKLEEYGKGTAWALSDEVCKKWIKVSQNRFFWSYESFNFTKNQKDALFDYMIANGMDKAMFNSVIRSHTYEEFLESLQEGKFLT